MLTSKLVTYSSLLISSSLLVYYLIQYKTKTKAAADKKLNRSKKKTILPKSWRKIGKIKSLYIYPLKSGHYIPIQRGYCDVRGLRHESEEFLSDRSFILFDENEGKFISSKQYSHLLLIQTEYKGEREIEFSVFRQQLHDKLTININDVIKANRIKKFILYRDEILGALDCGDLASDWFSQYLIQRMDRKIRLGLNCNFTRCLEDNHMRKYTTIYENVHNEDLGVYADMTSYMILNESSLTDLNEKMKEKNNEDVDMLQFRGNIIVDGPTAFAEDSWDLIRFNENVIMRVVKPCTRCLLTCVHPDTGVKNLQNEPLLTLREYRDIKDELQKKTENYAPMFGVYAGVHRCGNVSVDDDVFVANDE